VSEKEFPLLWQKHEETSVRRKSTIARGRHGWSAEQVVDVK